MDIVFEKKRVMDTTKHDHDMNPKYAGPTQTEWTVFFNQTEIASKEFQVTSFYRVLILLNICLSFGIYI